MSKKQWLVVCSIAILCSPNLHGQSAQKRKININQLFTMAEENSKSINSFKTGELAAQQALKTAKVSRLPDIEASLSGSYIGNGYLWSRKFKEGMSVDMPHWGNNFSLSAAQVIYSGGAVNAGIAIAELKQKMSRLDLEKNRQDIRFMLVSKYLDICTVINQQEVIKQNIELTKRLIENTNERTAQGTALKNDVTRYELQLENMKLQLRKLEDAYSILNHDIVAAINLPYGTEIIPENDDYTNLPEKGDEEIWINNAQNANVNIIQTQTAVDINKKLLKLERSEQLPKIMLMAEEHLDGPILVEVPVINKNFNYWFVGLGVKYNISSLFKNNKKIKQASLLLTQSEQNRELVKEGIGNAVHASYTDYLTSFSECDTQQKSVELATRNYNIVKDRYENGLALLTDMIDASNIKLSAELNLVNARISILFNYYKMKYNSSSL